MEEAIKNFNKQFAWTPKVHGPPLRPFNKFVVGGMGGSHLAAGLLHGLKHGIDLVIHRDYGLPALSDAKERLWIASSYSGNTEETIDFARAALKKRYAVAAVSVGGTLLEFARRNNLPHVVIPDTGIQPRSALGFSLLALAALLGNKKLAQELSALASALEPRGFETEGRMLAKTLFGKVPVVYASLKNQAIAYNWKIKFNETGKLPAFCNVFPELNHNEMTGFDILPATKELSRNFHFIFLFDETDHPRIKNRMSITKKLYEDRGLPVTKASFRGSSQLERMFNSLLLADWTALHLSKSYKTEAEQVPMVEEFKRLITVTGD